MISRGHDQDVQQVERALEALVQEPLHERRLPDPSFIWCKAQLLRRRDAEREAAAPIEVGDHVHVGAAVLGATALALGAWDRLPALGLTPGTA